jgi:hypothetical protein
MILKIQNSVKTIPSIELLRLLGASSSRNKHDLIGQFGSGFKYSLALLARFGLLESLKICMGNDVYTFSIKEHSTKDSTGYEDTRKEIVMKKSNGASILMGVDAEYGILDWTNVTMAVREFVSNAIDGTRSSEFPISQMTVELIPDHNSMRAKKDFITVYLRTTPEIDEYIRNIKKTFICLNDDYTEGPSVLINKEDGPARIYRKGVLVGEFGDHSLFHYDIPNISLKESRNVDSYEAQSQALRTLINTADPALYVHFLNRAIFDKDDNLWETSFSTYSLNNKLTSASDNVKSAWLQSVSATVGTNAVICENDTTARMVEGKGHKVIRASGDVADALKMAGLKTSSEVLNLHEIQGHEVVPPSRNVQNVANKVWNMCVERNLTMSKPQPEVFCFHQNTVVTGSLKGYQDKDAIFIRSDIQEDRGMDLLITVIEETAHYITGAADFTRDIQDFAFRIAATLMMEREELTPS